MISGRALDALIAFPPIRKGNSAVFHYRRNRWRWSRRFAEGRPVQIDRPVYLLGTQGGGLTLLSRILHRHPDAVSVSGNCLSWAGEDETQNALAPLLPDDFGWRRIDLSHYPVNDHNWLYANNDFLPFYRRTAEDVDFAAGARYRSIIQALLRQNALSSCKQPRFIDKSQSLTLRVGFIHAALADCDPRFVLITRNPYAIVWSSATRSRVIEALGLPIEERVRLCAEHWRNTFAAALADADSDPAITLRVWQFEELLEAPERIVAEICDFAELEYDGRILPSPNDTIPWESMYDAFNRRKWYPIRPDVNDRYLTEIPDWATDMITEICGLLIDRLGYERRNCGSDNPPRSADCPDGLTSRNAVL